MHKLLQEEKEAQFSMEKSREQFDRIMAVQHVTSHHFREHMKIQGQQGEHLQGSMFQCDRLWKSESAFSNIQFGYNPNRKRTFLYAVVKSSRYDSISDKNTGAMKEYQRNSTATGQKRSFSSRERNQWTVLVENTSFRPWREETIYKHFGRVNTEALAKVLPFLHRNAEKRRMEELKKEGKQLSEEISENQRNGDFQSNIALQSRKTEAIMEENFLNHLRLCKESASQKFFSSINRVFQGQKREIFEYYKDQRLKEEQEQAMEQTSVAEDLQDEGQEE